MVDKTLSFHCDLCKKTLAVKLTAEFQENFKKKADYWPYPMIYKHADHWAVVYLDQQFKERGVNPSKIIYEA